MGARRMTIDYRLGRWQDVLADVERCDVLLTDPPYSERTHDGERGLRCDPASALFKSAAPRRAIAYAHISNDDAHEFASNWVDRVAHWALMFGDHTTFAYWEEAWSAKAIGWVTFQPVLWVKKAHPPRFSGDGPASAAEYICVARPRKRVRDAASRRGWYHVETVTGPLTGGSTGVIGTKDVKGLCAILTDYTRPGDLVCDPFAGTATVAAACKLTGRHYIGSEVDPDTYAIGCERIANTQETPDWSWPDRWRDKDVEQGRLL